MNLSGPGVQSLLSEQRAHPENLVVIHDDLDLALGRLQFKQRGGDGGHKGIRSIVEALGDDRFLRLRIGIGRPPQGVDASDFVLSPFERHELDVIEDTVELAVEAIQTLIREGIKEAMQRYHTALVIGPQKDEELT
jgi:PTH1 family peptidyl-tRNA hydrolase